MTDEIDRAIDAWASKKAKDMLQNGDFLMFGLTMKQVLRLKKFYEAQTGKRAHELEE